LRTPWRWLVQGEWGYWIFYPERLKESKAIYAPECGSAPRKKKMAARDDAAVITLGATYYFHLCGEARDIALEIT